MVGIAIPLALSSLWQGPLACRELVWDAHLWAEERFALSPACCIDHLFPQRTYPNHPISILPNTFLSDIHLPRAGSCSRRWRRSR